MKTIEHTGELSGESPKRTGESPALPGLPVQVVEHLHRLLGGDARVEAMVLDYVEYRWQHRDLFRIPPNVASQIIRRPGDFLKAVKQHCEPELFAEGHQF